jgi:hypothetical protein
VCGGCRGGRRAWSVPAVPVGFPRGDGSGQAIAAVGVARLGVFRRAGARSASRTNPPQDGQVQPNDNVSNGWACSAQSRSIMAKRMPAAGAAW